MTHSKEMKNHTAVEDLPNIIGLEAIDHLVLIAVLLLSVGIALNGALKNKSRDNNDQQQQKQEIDTCEEESNLSEESSVEGSIIVDSNCDEEENTSVQNEDNKLKVSRIKQLKKTVLDTIPMFINTLSLFSLSGQIYENDTSVNFFLFGLFLSIVLIFISGIMKIFLKGNVNTISSYLKRRYNMHAASYFVTASGVVRHIVGGALNIYVVGVSISASMGISPLPIMFALTAVSVLCVSLGGIQSESSYRIGSLWLIVMTTISFIVLCMATIDLGGLGVLIMKAKAIQRISSPSISLKPWRLHSYWEATALGVILGLQMFLLSRTSLKNAILLKQNMFYVNIIIVFILIAIWTGLATWAGLCAAVVLGEIRRTNPKCLGSLPKGEGALLVLMSLKLHRIKGFRGFFIASLIAASISGLTRRFNQIIAVVWETSQVMCAVPDYRENDLEIEKIEKLDTKGEHEDLIKEMKYIYKKKMKWFSFIFKITTGMIIGLICTAILWVLSECHIGTWELWQGIVGVICGSVIGAILLGVFFPCFPHMSVTVGLIVGWLVPCYLVIGNIRGSFDVESRVHLPDSSAFSQLPLYKKINITDILINKYDLKEREFVVIGGETIELKENDQDKSRDHYIQRRKVWYNISYCFYGALGTLSCIITALIYTTATNRCTQKEFPRQLVSPMVYMFILTPMNTVKRPKRRKYIMRQQSKAFETFQEKAGF